MPQATPPQQSSSTAANLADQGQRAEAAKRKGFQQAIYASDTGGWKPSAPSLFGKASSTAPTQKPLMSKLGGT